jgi:radical SAM superfamily enzyme with C-terminal helix-hairpin-helix motif
LYGLASESRVTLAHNEAFLRRLMDGGLSVRRINIRRAMVFEGTALEEESTSGASRIREKDYRKWKDWVRGEVDPVMLGRVAPDGTTILNVIAEERSGNVMFGRPLGSYPLLVGIVSEDAVPGDRLDVMVTGRGGRSLTALPFPLDINSASRAQFCALPEIGRARAEALLARRPYRTAEDIKKSLEALDAPGIADRIMKYFIIDEG